MRWADDEADDVLSEADDAPGLTKRGTVTEMADRTDLTLGADSDGCGMTRTSGVSVRLMRFAGGIEALDMATTAGDGCGSG